jgi:hypothetical protein
MYRTAFLPFFRGAMESSQETPLEGEARASNLSTKPLFQEVQMFHAFLDHAKLSALAPSSLGPHVYLQGWARTHGGPSSLQYPTPLDEIQAQLALPRALRQTVVPFSGGQSYADAALNVEEITLNLSGMRRVLYRDPKPGMMRVEPGVTIGDIRRMAIGSGWWPAVAPTTMKGTISGCLAMNVHGRNAWKPGSIGGHTLSFDILFASSDLVTVTASTDESLFQAVIGGLNMIGVMTSVTLQLKSIHFGYLLAQRRPARSLEQMIAICAEEALASGYLESWIDGDAYGSHFGCSVDTSARLIDERDSQRLRIQEQIATHVTATGDTAPELLGWAMRLFFHAYRKIGNAFLFQQGVWREHGFPERKPLSSFFFHSDAKYRWVPAWMPHGLHTFQPFVPAEQASIVSHLLLTHFQQAGIAPIWCIFKQHRADPFLLRCQADGFSLEPSYRVAPHQTGKHDHRTVRGRACC